MEKQVLKKAVYLFVFSIFGLYTFCGCGYSQQQIAKENQENSGMVNEHEMNEDESLTGYLRVNQLGYLPASVKTAYLLTNDVLNPTNLLVISKDGTEQVLDSYFVDDQGSYGDFQYLYRIDFSEFQDTGTYKLSIGNLDSDLFTINEQLYGPLIKHSLQFMEGQRCGVGIEEVHAACHLQDGIAANGAITGSSIDVTGGWHDAGDYIKFSITSGYSTYLLFHAAEVLNASDDAMLVFQEGEVGLQWLSKMWDAEQGVLYYQVSDEADHDEWRLPEDDRLNPRPVYACDPGKGANIAGKSAAAMALASRLYTNQTSVWHNEELAEVYLSRAISLYEFGLQNLDAQPSNPADFYTEMTWKDDMALAAVELYGTTGEEKYKQDALLWMDAISKGSGFSWGEMGAAVYYKAAKYGMIPNDEASSMLDADLRIAAGLSEKQSFSVSIPSFHWGSAETMASIVLEAMWYDDLVSDREVRSLALRQMDYLLGANLWGVSWVSGIGSHWSKNPHHQIADLTNSDLPGFWNEGPVPLEVYESSGPDALKEADEFAAFQTVDAVYHDDTEDWVTNEPTITMNATGIAVCSWLAK